jgi:hypothetical protein
VQRRKASPSFARSTDCKSDATRTKIAKYAQIRAKTGNQKTLQHRIEGEHSDKISAELLQCSRGSGREKMHGRYT